MKIKLVTFSTPTGTHGYLSFDGFNCYTVELPWLDNATSISCIPEGSYKVTKHESPKHGKCLKIHDVPNRTHILIHIANYVRQLEGCIGVGLSLSDMDKDGVLDVGSSRMALNEMLRLLPNNSEIEISRAI